MTPAQTDRFVEALIPVLNEAIERKVSQRLDAFCEAQNRATLSLITHLGLELSRHFEATLERKLAERPAVSFWDHYKGVWAEDTAYSRNDLVTHQGSLWACTGPTYSRPGTPDSAWRLVVKKGKDGRDAKP